MLVIEGLVFSMVILFLEWTGIVDLQPSSGMFVRDRIIKVAISEASH